MIIYHNPRCRKSRETLNLLNEKGASLEVVEYLKNPLNEGQLKSVIDKLGISPEKLVRKGEDDYKSNFKGKEMSDADWIKAIAKYPKLMERPVVVDGDKAVIGRPPENVLILL